MNTKNDVWITVRDELQSILPAEPEEISQVGTIRARQSIMGVGWVAALPLLRMNDEITIANWCEFVPI